MAVRVLHCYADHKWTGPSEPIMRLCAALTARGWTSDLACGVAPPGQGDDLAAAARALGLTVLELFEPAWGLGAPRFLRERRRLVEVVRTGAYGIVHCHGSWDHFVMGWAHRLGRLTGTPVLRSDHKAQPYARSWLWRSYFGPRMIDHLVVLSDRFLVQALDRLELEPGSVTTVRPSVDLDLYRPLDPAPAVRAELGLTEGDVAFGVVARVQRHRRFESILQAAALTRQEDPRVKVVVCGRGTHKEEVLDRPARALGLEGTVLPVGYRRDDYRDVLGAFDAGIMLVPGSDGSCRAALQMAAMAKPLIVGRRGVLPDIVRDGETGLVIEDDPARLAEAMLEVAGNAERRQEWGRAARERVCRHFAPDREAAAVIGVYERLLPRS